MSASDDREFGGFVSMISLVMHLVAVDHRTCDAFGLYTDLRFQFPCLNRTVLTAASSVYAASTDTNTACDFIEVTNANVIASGISNIQNTPMLIHVGLAVSPAPLNDCVNVIPYAKNGKPNAIVRRPNVATSATAHDIDRVR